METCNYRLTIDGSLPINYFCTGLLFRTIVAIVVYVQVDGVERTRLFARRAIK